MGTTDMGNLPRRARFQGRIVRVIGYDSVTYPRRPIEIVDTNDQRTFVARDRLTFLKEKTRARAN